jgi:hypothetical protein
MTPRVSDQKIEGLKKITLDLEAGTTPDSMNLTGGPVAFEFIFGLGKQGLTPFEYALAGRVPGQEVMLTVNTNETNRFFEHLIPPVPNRIDSKQHYYLKVRIAEVSEPDSRSVVKAMAALSECGGAESCDCGCSSHLNPFSEK